MTDNSQLVKPLFWGEYDAIEQWDAEAGSFGVFYGIELNHDGFRAVFDHEAVGALGTFDTLDAAKEAAQADYTARILSALNLDAFDALAANQPAPAGCTMGVGCDETGVCYAEANGQPDRCEKRALAADTGQAVAFVMRYGGRCRACGDCNGYCQDIGLPCDQKHAERVIKHVLAALEYGRAHGFITHPTPPADTGQVVEATPDMIEAGARKIGGGSNFDHEDRQDIAREVYRAMVAARPAHLAPLDAERVREAWAYRVHDCHIARSPVKARAKFPEATEHLYPASRHADAIEMARLLGGTCTPLYPPEDAR